MIRIASQKKENWWVNIPELTGPMDLAIPALAQLNPNVLKKDLEYFCEFLSVHTLAIKHNKSKKAIYDHMKLNIELYIQGKPFHH